MRFIYNLLVSISWAVLHLLAKVNPKLALFVKGRKQTIAILKNAITPKDQVIWIHAASLGEYEQGLPILEELKLIYPKHKLLLTFFSPSGYEIKKNATPADVVTYLPLDTKNKVREFLDTARPNLAIFIKYEIWPNYLTELKRRNTPALLVSALFKKEQIYFKWYGSFMRRVLKNFNHFYLQDQNSKLLLKSIGITNCCVTGDTRLDRVSKILDTDNSLDFMTQFNTSPHCLVAGSTWPEDEELLVDYINKSTTDIKFIIAPHNIKHEHSIHLKNAITKPTLLYSELKEQDLSETKVLIIDTIGLLTKIYSYATMAYVGGGFATGLHNTLEPAVFGIPVIIGPEYKGFIEAEELVSLGGIISIVNKEELTEWIEKLQGTTTTREKLGNINTTYITKNKGATNKIMEAIQEILKL